MLYSSAFHELEKLQKLRRGRYMDLREFFLRDTAFFYIHFTAQYLHNFKKLQDSWKSHGRRHVNSIWFSLFYFCLTLTLLSLPIICIIFISERVIEIMQIDQFDLRSESFAWFQECLFHTLFPPIYWCEFKNKSKPDIVQRLVNPPPHVQFTRMFPRNRVCWVWSGSHL